MIVWPAKVVTADRTWHKAQVGVEESGWPAGQITVRDRRGQDLYSRLVASFEQISEAPLRWRAILDGDEFLVVEMMGGCGCGGTYENETAPDDLALLV
jgi:hypothetical protein